MARIRTIKPEAFQSDTLSGLSVESERTFLALLTQADDVGRFRDQPAVLNGAIWPLRPDHTVRDMEYDLSELVRVGIGCRYEVGDRKYMHIPSFLDHQRINRPTASKIPACPVHDQVSVVVDAGSLLPVVTYCAPSC